MMEPDIQAVFLDLGNTLRILIKDEEHMSRARQELVRLVGVNADPVEFCSQLDLRYKSYRKWAFETLIEAPEEELWTRWLLPDFPTELVTPLAGELTFQFRQSSGRRIVQTDGRDVVVELEQRGYLLGIISNVITRGEIPEWLETDGFSQYFKAVVLSSVFGRRKPDPSIFWEAARLIGVDPAHCAYVGDNPSRDVVGARRAGFGMVIILIEPEELAAKDPIGEYKPDFVIQVFKQLLDIFPARAAGR